MLNTRTCSKRRILCAILVVAMIITVATISLYGCTKPKTPDAADPTSFDIPVSDTNYEAESFTVDEVSFPAGWNIEEIHLEDDAVIPAFTKVEIAFLPNTNIDAHHNGTTVQTDMIDDYADVDAKIQEFTDKAVIVYDENVVACDPQKLLINAPDIFGDSMEYDAVYSYSAPSRSGGNEIPGLTECRVDGYADGKQPNEYLKRDEYAIPIAYGTAVKLNAANQTLKQDGYAIKIWDAYRPFSGSAFISQKFTDAFSSSPAIRDAIGGWGVSWYAASGASGHNYATDVDITLVDITTGKDVAMPSHFDAFDNSAHLTRYQLSSSQIDETQYVDAVIDNEACMALHRSMTDAGFSELASEWWHFSDNESKTTIREIVGSEGMNFVAK